MVQKNASIGSIKTAILAENATFFGFSELFEDFFLLFRKIFRGFNNDRDDVRTTIAIGAEWDAVTRKLEWGTGLGASWDFHDDFAVDSFDFDFATKSCVDHADFFFGKDDVPFASEGLMRFDMDANIEVARLAALWGWAAFAAQTNRHAVVDASWDFDFKI